MVLRSIGKGRDQRGSSASRSQSRIEDSDGDASLEEDNLELAQKEKAMFLQGALHLADTVQRWRRILIKIFRAQEMAMQLRSWPMQRNLVLSRTLLPSAWKSPEECTHPVAALIRRANGTSRYVHCRACAARIHLEKRCSDSPQRTSRSKAVSKVPDAAAEPLEIPPKGRARKTSSSTAAGSTSRTDAGNSLDQAQATARVMAESLGQTLGHALAQAITSSQTENTQVLLATMKSQTEELMRQQKSTHDMMKAALTASTVSK